MNSVISILALGMATWLWATEAPTDLLADIKNRVNPIVESVLQHSCGEDCPSFQVEPKMKASATDSVQDLGFSVPSTEASRDVTSVAIRVLINDRVPQAQRSSLREVLQTRVGNEVSVPVSVAFKGLAVPVPPARSAQDTLFTAITKLAGVTAWPLALILLGLIALGSLVAYFRHVHQLREPISEIPSPSLATETMTPPTMNESGVDLPGFISGNRADLAWWLEERSRAHDLTALGRALALFPAAQLSSALILSPQALDSMAKAQPGQSGNSQEELEWMDASLQPAHWRRLASEANPLKALDGKTDAWLIRILRQLSDPLSQSLLLSGLPQTKWPTLLASVPSAARVELGVSLHSWDTVPENRKKQALGQIASVIHSLEQDLASDPDGVLRDYSFYLSETEGQSLARRINELGGEGRTAPSLDHLIDEFEPSVLGEICLRMDVESLKSLVLQVSPDHKRKILDSIPKGLKDRLSTVPQKSSSSEATSMRARASLLSTYREYQQEAQ